MVSGHASNQVTGSAVAPLSASSAQNLLNLLELSSSDLTTSLGESLPVTEMLRDSFLSVLSQVRPDLLSHSQRVAFLCHGIALHCGWTSRKISTLVVAALLHDIGAVILPPELSFWDFTSTSFEERSRRVGLDILAACHAESELLEILALSQDFRYREPSPTESEHPTPEHVIQGAAILNFANLFDAVRHRENGKHDVAEIIAALKTLAETPDEQLVVSGMEEWLSGRDSQVEEFDVSSLQPGELGMDEETLGIVHATILEILFELYEMEEKFDGFFVLDATGRFLLWNYGCQKRLGKTIREMRNKHWTNQLMGYCNEEGLAFSDSHTPLYQTLETGKPAHLELCLKDPNEKLIHTEVNSVPIIGRDGLLMGIVEVHRSKSTPEAEDAENLFTPEWVGDLVDTIHNLEADAEPIAEVPDLDEKYLVELEEKLGISGIVSPSDQQTTAPVIPATSETEEPSAPIENEETTVDQESPSETIEEVTESYPLEAEEASNVQDNEITEPLAPQESEPHQNEPERSDSDVPPEEILDDLGELFSRFDALVTDETDEEVSEDGSISLSKEETLRLTGRTPSADPSSENEDSSSPTEFSEEETGAPSDLDQPSAPDSPVSEASPVVEEPESYAPESLAAEPEAPPLEQPMEESGDVEEQRFSEETDAVIEEVEEEPLSENSTAEIPEEQVEESAPVADSEQDESLPSGESQPVAESTPESDVQAESQASKASPEIEEPENLALENSVEESEASHPELSVAESEGVAEESSSEEAETITERAAEEPLEVEVEESAPVADSEQDELLLPEAPQPAAESTSETNVDLEPPTEIEELGSHAPEDLESPPSELTEAVSGSVEEEVSPEEAKTDTREMAEEPVSETPAEETLEEAEKDSEPAVESEQNETPLSEKSQPVAESISKTDEKPTQEPVPTEESSGDSDVPQTIKIPEESFASKTTSAPDPDEAQTEPFVETVSHKEWDKFVKYLIDPSSPEHETVSVLFLDIDHFRAINEGFGRQIGTDLIKEISFRLSQACGKRELSCRYGGEQFVIACPGLSLEKARKRGDQFRKLIEKTRFDVLPFHSLTASIGITTSEQGDDLNALMDRAEYGLSQAKKQGRNCVVSATSAELESEQEITEDKSSNLVTKEFEIETHFEAMIASDMIVYKLGGFLYDMHAKLLHVDRRHVSIRVGKKGLLPYWGRQDDERPVLIELELAENWGEEKNKLGKLANTRINVRIRPDGWVRNQDTFVTRAQLVLRELKGYFVTN
ncbi:MAG: diguanylate cyclase [Planctomycetaceae bacterium]|nr:diguanylate cyclase [Planctomycetaceae bacterium]